MPMCSARWEEEQNWIPPRGRPRRGRAGPPAHSSRRPLWRPGIVRVVRVSPCLRLALADTSCRPLVFHTVDVVSIIHVSQSSYSTLIVEATRVPPISTCASSPFLRCSLLLADVERPSPSGSGPCSVRFIPIFGRNMESHMRSGAARILRCNSLSLSSLLLRSSWPAPPPPPPPLLLLLRDERPPSCLLRRDLLGKLLRGRATCKAVPLALFIAFPCCAPSPSDLDPIPLQNVR